MKPAEIQIARQQFENEVRDLDDDGLLNRWIAFDGSSESKEPDLGLSKSLTLEALLQQRFGFEWKRTVASRSAKH